jgi:TonB-linked SusC/RagA family outer membrane protein
MQNAILYAGSAVVKTVQQLSRWTGYNRQFFIKGFITMKLLLLLIIASCLQAGATGYAQTINLSLTNAKLEKVFKEIEKQSNYRFIYTREQLESTKSLTIDVKNASIQTVLDFCFKEQPVTYTVEELYVIVKRKDISKATEMPGIPHLIISGKVVDEEGYPIPGATISLRGSSIAIASDDKGEWKLEYDGNFSVIVVSSIGYSSKEVQLSGRNYLRIVLEKAVSSLDETIVIAYGKTTQRLNTGSVGRVTAAEISKQPVSNVLAALEGRVAGLIVNQTTGVAGGKFKVEIRGRNSIAQGSEPLFIIDGVPFASSNNSINQLSSALAAFAGQGLSPFNGINPSDIESIEILKDADATAIYGSRGANGVVLITTKKGKSGKTTISVNMYSGFSKVARTMDMMNTQDYVRMRKEAFTNDQVNPDIFNAPDLLVWDTTRYTDLKETLIGGKSYLTDAQVSVSGGNINTQFLMGAGYHYESAIFSKDLTDKRGSFHFSLHHNSTNQKFHANLICNYGYDHNQISVNDLTSYVILPPNLPRLVTTDGKLNWEEGGVSFTNPLGVLFKKYNAKTDNLLDNLQLSYQLVPGLTIKASFGYNIIWVDETSAAPKLSQNPQLSPSATAVFGNNRYNSWSIEPQAEYQKNIGKGKLNILLGGSWQEMVNKRSTIQGTGYTNDALLASITGAGVVTVTDGYTQYRYEGFFGRINYNWRDKYILNVTGRRDGSSRFGTNKQFANFIAGGAAWIFSNEKFIKNSLAFLSFGKLRGSYGITGNDQIGDYQYLDAWTPVSNRYQGTSVVPTRLFNGDYSWEKNKKLEGTIELGFLKDIIFFSGTFFINKSGNQLVNYRLPGQTGFQNIIRNFPAVVENTGWEFSVSTKNIASKNFKWSSSANLTFPKNELVSFPGLKSSSYATNYVEGKSLNTVYGYHLLGVDAASGIYQFEDVDKNGSIGLTDYVPTYNLDPKFYGGLNNSFNYMNWELSIFFEFRKQTGFNYNNYPITGFTPGMMFNLPVIMLDRWQKPGDNSAIQQFTQTYTPAYDAQYNFTLSDGRFSDASYIRLKNLYLAYDLPAQLKKRIHVDGCRFYLSGQNLLTITNYEGSDPEIQNLFILPPLKTITAGIQLLF